MPRLLQQQRHDAILVEALREIIAAAPDRAPEEESYDDTESAYGNGQDVGMWDQAERARKALRRLRIPLRAPV
jgi:hypothetical protein